MDDDCPDFWPAILIGLFVAGVALAPIVVVALPLFVMAMLIVHVVFK
jgi:hypothetical protein